MKAKRILVIDDDHNLTDMVKLNLMATGKYEVCVENRAISALATARTFRPDLVLLDYVMPGLDGGDVSTSIHQDPLLQGVPIIMVTALVSNAEMGPDGTSPRCGHLMLAKPVRFANLLRCIEEQIAKHPV
jgi:DNA-binding response OmpR family regulator